MIYIIKPFYSSDVELPCYCKKLKLNIDESRTRLHNQYGNRYLDLAPTFSSSCHLNALEKSILRVLERGAESPFRIGLVGGSYAIPQGDFANARSFNVSRWLNIMLSVSSCSSNIDDSVLISEGN